MNTRIDSSRSPPMVRHAPAHPEFLLREDASVARVNPHNPPAKVHKTKAQKQPPRAAAVAIRGYQLPVLPPLSPSQFRQLIAAVGPTPDDEELRAENKKAKVRSTSAKVLAVLTSPLWVPFWIAWQLMPVLLGG
jgi:hypothetical protein